MPFNGKRVSQHPDTSAPIVRQFSDLHEMPEIIIPLTYPYLGAVKKIVQIFLKVDRNLTEI
jgi:hypothetical protein